MNKGYTEERKKKDEEYLNYQSPKAKELEQQKQNASNTDANIASTPSGASTAASYSPSNYTQAMNLTNSLLSQIANKSQSSGIKDILSKIQNREKFTYDINKDPLFQQALSSAMTSGKTAMKDTMGQAASLTGGYGSSYATTAGSNAYNNLINQVYDSAPQYYDRAYQEHQAGTEDLYRQYASLAEQENSDYQRLLNLYNLSYNYANDLYNKEYTEKKDALAQEWQERTFQAARDDETYERELDQTKYNYQLTQDAKADEKYLNENDWDGNGVVNTLDQAYYNEFVKGKQSSNSNAYSLTDTEIKEISRIFNAKGGGDEGVDAVYDYLALKGKTPTTDEAVAIVQKAYTYTGYDDTDSPTSATTPAKGLVDGFKAKKGDNFDVSVGDKTYRVENQGVVTDTKLTGEFDKLNINDGEAFLYNADNRVYVKKGNKYYKTGATEVLGFNTSGHSNLKSALYSIANGGK